MVYYINLDHRRDRNEETLREIKKLPRGSIVERVSAVYEKERGHLGCSKSHIVALKKFIQSGYDTCIILEDDFEFVNGTGRLENFLYNSFPFDVVMLATNETDAKPCEHSGFKKVISAGTTSGYIVSKDFAPTLLENFQTGAFLLENDYDNHPTYAIDQYWKNLQPKSKWYSFDPPCGRQRKSYSDILGGVVDYKL
jgi:GR25 family glycosyltransferase involved in LPS biosynthesis